MTLGEVVEVAGAVLPGIDVRFGESSLSSEHGLGYFDQSAIQRDLGFEPRFDLASGIRCYADLLRERSIAGVHSP